MDIFSNIEKEEIIDLSKVKKDLDLIEDKIAKAKKRHNEFLKELGLPELK